MPSQQRSKSAPQLAASLAFQSACEEATLYRKQQSFSLFPIVTQSTSSPRDGPFALSGFFRSYMSPMKGGDGDKRWNWVRGDEEDDVESDPTVPPTPVEYDESENLDWVIQRDDKLGILRLREYQTLPPFATLALSRIVRLNTAIFLVHFSEGKQKAQPLKPQSDQDNAIEPPSKLLYLEQNIDSFEDVCDTYRACRQARDLGPFINTKDMAYYIEAGNESPVTSLLF